MAPTQWLHHFNRPTPDRQMDETIAGREIVIRRIAGAQARSAVVAIDHEAFVIGGKGIGVLRTGSDELSITSRQIGIAPAGRLHIALQPGTELYVVTPTEAAATGIDPAYERTGPQKLSVVAIDEVRPPTDNPRIRMLQTARMSMNIVAYSGPRDRTRLSPHAHADFEQVGLVLEGDFIHHLRFPWSADADQWIKDQHLAAAANSVVVIPRTVIHTSEGIGPGDHLVVEFFSPPRADFIAKRWIANAHDYRPVPTGSSD